MINSDKEQDKAKPVDIIMDMLELMEENNSGVYAVSSKSSYTYPSVNSPEEAQRIIDEAKTQGKTH